MSSFSFADFNAWFGALLFCDRYLQNLFRFSIFIFQFVLRRQIFEDFTLDQLISWRDHSRSHLYWIFQLCVWQILLLFAHKWRYASIWLVWFLHRKTSPWLLRVHMGDESGAINSDTIDVEHICIINFFWRLVRRNFFPITRIIIFPSRDMGVVN